MTRFLLSTLCLLLAGSSSAFVVSPHKASSIVSKQQQQPMQLHVMEPFQEMLSDVAGSALTLSDAADAVPEVGGISYSRVSYYTILGLYVMSFPGLWSQIKRSTTAKIKRKTFVSPGENAKDGKSLREQAGEIMAYMKANNYEVVESGETIKFQGLVQRSISQACFLVFCTALGMASLALVLQIQFQDLTLPLGLNWFWLVALSPYAGIYYWKAGDRVDDFELKLSANDEETENEIAVQGNDDELERMWRTLGWTEQGMLKVEGLLES
mmetsp:Transcript_4430/g.6552  ORF Transcript_4430/g.6552 Transcript_4430/m.6552 type:complete len:268 (-) Transcript_4430:250-1053(-)